MKDPVFNLDSWEPMFPIDNDMAVDSQGRFIMRMGDGMAMDMDTGEMQFTTPWETGANDTDWGSFDDY